MKVLFDFRNPLLQIVVEKVLELTGKLNAGRATTNDNHMEQTLDLLGGLILESGSLNTVHDPLADALRIADLLQEQAMFSNTGNT